MAGPNMSSAATLYQRFEILLKKENKNTFGIGCYLNHKVVLSGEKSVRSALFRFQDLVLYHF
jgi:hypothetical protein